MSSKDLKNEISSLVQTSIETYKNLENNEFNKDDRNLETSIKECERAFDL
jgi:hypothetical protein